MNDLIKALQIFAKYGNPECPTHCEHDKLQVCIKPNLVSGIDKLELSLLSFYIDEDDDCFYSFRFGSC